VDLPPEIILLLGDMAASDKIGALITFPEGHRRLGLLGMPAATFPRRGERLTGFHGTWLTCIPEIVRDGCLKAPADAWDIIFFHSNAGDQSAHGVYDHFTRCIKHDPRRPCYVEVSCPTGFDRLREGGHGSERDSCREFGACRYYRGKRCERSTALGSALQLEAIWLPASTTDFSVCAGYHGIGL
jgi:hypothetical protein